MFKYEDCGKRTEDNDHVICNATMVSTDTRMYLNPTAAVDRVAEVADVYEPHADADPADDLRAHHTEQ